MATEGLRNQEWLDRGSDSRYPLLAIATATDLSGAFTIPNDFLASLYIGVPVDLQLNPQSVFISQIVHTPNVITLQFSATVAGQVVVIARADLSLPVIAAQIATVGYGLAVVEGVSPYLDIRGRAAVARLENIQQQPVGIHGFNFVGAGLDVDAIRPSIRHVHAFEVEQESGQFTRLTGVLRLKSGTNTRIRVATEDGEPVVYLDAIDASQFNEQLECEIGLAPAIRRINGLPGNAQREISIKESRCLSVTAAGSELTLRNRCSEPCASCAEAEAVLQKIDPIAAQLPSMQNFIARLQAVIETQQANILASQGPLQCLSASTTAEP